MAKNFVQEGENLTITAPYAVSSGGGCMVNNLFGVAITDIANGEQGVIATEGVWTLAKDAGGGTNWAAYGDVYWNASTKKVTGASSGNQLIGTGMAVAATGDTTANVRLGIKIAPQAELYLPVNFLALANGTNVDQTFFIAPAEMEVVSISEIHSTAGSNGSAVSLTVERLQGTETSTQGDDLLGATKIDLKGTINTVQTPALTSTTAHRTLAAGDRLGVDYTGTITTLAGVCVSVLLRFT